MSDSDIRRKSHPVFGNKLFEKQKWQIRDVSVISWINGRISINFGLSASIKI